MCFGWLIMGHCGMILLVSLLRAYGIDLIKEILVVFHRVHDIVSHGNMRTGAIVTVAVAKFE